MTPKHRITAHPGKILKDEFLAPLNLSVNALATELRVPTTRIHEIVHGKRAVSADTAMRLGRYFGTSAEFWLNLQTMHELTKVNMESGAKITEDVRPRQSHGNSTHAMTP